MIVASGVLTPVAVALLVVGLLTGSLPVMAGAVAASVTGAVCLVVAVRQRRAEFAAPAVSPASGVELAEQPFPPMAPVVHREDNLD